MGKTLEVNDEIDALKITKKDNKKPKRNSRKRKSPEMDEKEEEAAGEPPKKKRKKKRGWSANEESLFLSGLEKYGRDWKSVAQHVGNDRDAASIRSHAQVHFLKLLKRMRNYLIKY